VKRSRSSSVGIATGYGLDGRGSNPGKAKIYLFSTASRPALGLTQTPIQWVLGAISPGVMWRGHEADHSPPSTAEVKNGGAIPSLLHMSLCHSAYLIKYRDNFTFTLLVNAECIKVWKEAVLIYLNISSLLWNSPIETEEDHESYQSGLPIIR
jgi:hypothetical protein